MKVDWKDPADAMRLRDWVHPASNARQRDRYRVVLIAGAGSRSELRRGHIAAAVGRGSSSTRGWDVTAAAASIRSCPGRSRAPSPS